MAVEKRLKKVWNGLAWVEVHHPTSDDLVLLPGGQTLRTKLAEMDYDFNAHATDTALHTTPEDKTKLSNLPLNANETFATQADLDEHIEDDDVHLTEEWLDELGDRLDTFATKDDLAGQPVVLWFPTVEAMNAFDMTDYPTGTTAWVAKLPGDPGEPQKSGKYMWDGSAWQFLFEGDANVVINWEDVNGRPDVDPDEIEDAVAQMHEHDNMAVLDSLDKDGDGYLTVDGRRVGEQFNRVFLSSETPTASNVGDLWLPLVPTTP